MIGAIRGAFSEKRSFTRDGGIENFAIFSKFLKINIQAISLILFPNPIP